MEGIGSAFDRQTDRLFVGCSVVLEAHSELDEQGVRHGRQSSCQRAIFKFKNEISGLGLQGAGVVGTVSLVVVVVDSVDGLSVELSVSLEGEW